MIAINIEMPKSCEVCDFRKSDPYSGEVYCSKAIGSDTIIYEKERLDNCPLVEIITCKDCNHWKFNENASFLCGYCSHLETETGEDFYCGDAERRES